MSHPIRLLLVAGARPNFMKVAPLMKAVDTYNGCKTSGSPGFEAFLVHTGQHYDTQMSQAFFTDLGIPEPDVNLDVGSGTHALQTANIMIRFEPVCEKLKPDWVMVVGDVNSTMACTLVSAKLGMKIAHVEAGLRSFDRSMPEEINRLVTDALADLLLTPSEDANQNLLREGIGASKIRLVGNIMIDALMANLEKAEASNVLGNLKIEPGRFAYVTLHRPSNVDNPEKLGTFMLELERLGKFLPVVFPIHPRTRRMLASFGIRTNGANQLRLVEPLGYCDSIKLTESARLVITDSGGLQEETTFFGTPCLTLRPNTERPITIQLGSNRLTTLDQLGTDVERILQGPEKLGTVPPLWDGHAAARILHHLAEGIE